MPVYLYRHTSQVPHHVNRAIVIWRRIWRTRDSLEGFISENQSRFTSLYAGHSENGKNFPGDYAIDIARGVVFGPSIAWGSIGRRTFSTTLQWGVNRSFESDVCMYVHRMVWICGGGYACL